MPTILRVIGDIHGNIQKYFQLASEVYFSVQVGDFGFFQEFQQLKGSNLSTHTHKILLGNHDYRGVKFPHVLPRFGQYFYGIEQPRAVKYFYISGAKTIDLDGRIFGRDLFVDEELTIQEGYDCIDSVKRSRPEIIISHDCPNYIAKEMLERDIEITRTRQILEIIAHNHQPRLWIFGHHHRSWKKMIEGCWFICLAPEEKLDLNMDTCQFA